MDVCVTFIHQKSLPVHAPARNDSSIEVEINVKSSIDESFLAETCVTSSYICSKRIADVTDHIQRAARARILHTLGRNTR